MNKITLLGSGTSTGVPILGCKCKVCQSNDLRNKRLRTSAVIETTDQKKILIDASPDLRTQLLQNKIEHIDAVIVTHAHADHILGMDDLRPFGFRATSPIPVYADDSAGEDLKRKFTYIFERDQYFKNKPILGGGIPLLDLHSIGEGTFTILNEDFSFIPQPHGHEDTLIILHNQMAYVTDVRELTDEVVKKLSDSGLELLVIDCLRPSPHQTHLHLDRTLEYISRINPRLAVLTHMGHEWDYLELSAEILRRGVKNTFPGIDGQSFLYS